MAKRQARTIRHPSSKTLIQRQTQREMVSRPSGQVLDKPITTSVPAIKAARANAVPPPSGNWYTKDDAVKVGEYLAGTRELSFNELQKYDLNRDGKVTAADGMFVRQYLTDKVVRGPSGYSPIDANLIALHMVGAITIPPELIGRYDANGDGKITIDDARFIAQAIARPPVSESSPPKGMLPPEMEWYVKADGTWGTRLKIQLSNNKGKTGTSTAVKQRKTTGVTPIGTNSQATVTTSQAKPKAKAKRKATAKAKRSTPKVSSVWL